LIFADPVCSGKNWVKSSIERLFSVRFQDRAYAVLSACFLFWIKGGGKMNIVTALESRKAELA